MSESSKVKLIVLGIFGLVVGAGVYAYMALMAPAPQPAKPEPPAPVVAPRPPPEAPPEPTEPAPDPPRTPVEPEKEPDDESIRKAVNSLSEDPLLPHWLATEHLRGKFVALVESVANGRSPRKLVPFLSPAGSFPVLEREGVELIDPEGYKRYDKVTAAFCSLDTAGVVRLLKKIDPWLEGSYSEIGKPGRTFRMALAQAMGQLLQVPIITGEIPLERIEVTLKIGVVELEAMSQAQKHLFRMGPANIGRIQAKLRELGKALGFEASLRRAKPLSCPICAQVP